jgi:hypothetical protein
MNTKYSNILHWFIILTFIGLYAIVSIISTIHVIDFFKLSNPEWLAVSLAVAFEIGAAASLASLIILDKMNKPLVWGLFIVLTLMQMMGNMYFSFTHLQDFTGWVELFGLVDEEVVYQKRVLSFISGGILPLVALGFIKSLVDYIKPKDSEKEIDNLEVSKEEIVNTVSSPALNPDYLNHEYNFEELLPEPEPIEEEELLPEPEPIEETSVIPIEEALNIEEVKEKPANWFFTQEQAVNYAKNKLDDVEAAKNREILEINKKVKNSAPSSRQPPAR